MVFLILDGGNQRLSKVVAKSLLLCPWLTVGASLPVPPLLVSHHNSSVGRGSSLEFPMFLPSRGSIYCRHRVPGERASASPGTGLTVKQQLVAGLSFSHNPVAQPWGTFSSCMVLFQDTEDYSNKALRHLCLGHC